MLLPFALLLCAADARVWSNTIINSPLTVLGSSSGSKAKFAFGAGGGTATISLPYNPLTPVSSTLVMTNSINDPSCGATPDLVSSLLSPTPTGSATQTIPFSSDNKVWTFALTGGSANLGSILACQTPLSTDYTLTARQANGSQLSYEEQGLPAIYACFWVFMALAVGAHAYGHYIAPLPQGYPKGQRPPLVSAVLASLALHAGSDFFHLVEWSYVDITGAESGYFLAVVGGLLRLGALVCIWVTAAFIATGYGVTVRRVSLREDSNWRGALLLGVLLVLGLTATLLYATASRGGNGAAAGGVGITLVCFLAGYLAWFLRRTQAVISAEVSLPKKALLTALMWTTVGTFLILPFAELLSEWRRGAGSSCCSTGSTGSSHSLPHNSPLLHPPPQL